MLFLFVAVSYHTFSSLMQAQTITPLLTGTRNLYHNSHVIKNKGNTSHSLFACCYNFREVAMFD